jgi:acyl carrier protein
MIVSLIETPNYSYINLHAEEVISSNYLNDDNQGIYISSLQFETVNRLFNFLKKAPAKFSNIVLDFNNIQNVQSNIIDKIIEIRDLGYKLVFINISEKLIKPLALNTIENSKNILNVKNEYNIFYFFSEKESDLYQIDIESGNVFYYEFKKRLIKYIDEYKRPHASSFVYLHSFIDLKKFISFETPFIYYALYRLAIKIKENWESNLKDKPILVGQSLTSTFIVSVLSKLLKLDILVFDKIGPVNKLYNKLEKHNYENKKYIVVSDLVCLGTEVKITKNLIEFSGGKYLGNVSLAKIETLTREDLDLDSIDRTISVFSITDKNNVELNYYIYTNLKKLNG